MNFARFLFALQYLWQGMLCIFVVIGALILAVYGLNKLTSLPIFNRGDKN